MRSRLDIKPWLLAGTALAACLPVTSSRAQDAGETTLQEINVQGSGGENPKAEVPGFVAKTSSTASKTGTPILETPQSISVITRDQIEAQNAQTLGQALNYTPGVVGTPFGSDPRFDSPRIRGFDGRQSQFLNGLRMMRTAGAPAVEIYGLERVEVLRGPASVMYGQGNPGGLINLISKRPKFEAFGEVGGEIGSYDRRQAMFDVGGPIGEGSDFAYRLTGLARKSGTQTDHLDNDRYFLAPSFTWQPSDQTTFTVLASIQHDNPDTPSGLPAQYTLNHNGNRLSRDFFVGDKDFDKSNRTLANIGYEFEHKFNDVFTVRQNVRYSHFNWDYQSIGMSSAGLDVDGRTIRRTATFQDEKLRTFNVDTHLQADFATGPITHKMLFGVDYRHFSNDVTTEFRSASGLDVLNPDYDTPVVIGPQTLFAAVDSKLTQVGAYAQDELSFGNWRATLGLRYDKAKTNGDSTNALGVARPLDTDDHKVTGRAGLSYLFENGIAPYVSYATSFEAVPPTATRPDTKPTTGEQVEAGVKYQPQGWNGFFTAAVYDLRQKNVLTSINSTILGQIGEVRVKGFELEGVTSLAEGLDLRAAYSYMKARVVEDGSANDGNRPDNTPKHAGSLWVNYKFQPGSAVEGLGLGGGVRYVGSRYGDVGNQFHLNGITLFDAAVSYEIKGYKASLNFQNMADKRYVATCGTFGCYYGDGRTVTGKLTYSW